MKIIISPAKTMISEPEDPKNLGIPALLPQTEALLETLRALDYGELKQLLGCSDKLAELNYRRYQTMDLRRGLTPALLSYEGIQYQYLAPRVLTGAAYDYLQAHLRILSGFYGILRPWDGIVPYRLEMQARLQMPGCRNLYDYWGSSLGRALEGEPVLNLASEEYSRAARQGLEPGQVWVTAYFGTLRQGKFREQGTACKMARGAMVRYLAEEQVEDLAGVRAFGALGYRLSQELSRETELYFCKE